MEHTKHSQEEFTSKSHKSDDTCLKQFHIWKYPQSSCNSFKESGHNPSKNLKPHHNYWKTTWKCWKHEAIMVQFCGGAVLVQPAPLCGATCTSLSKLHQNCTVLFRKKTCLFQTWWSLWKHWLFFRKKHLIVSHKWWLWVWFDWFSHTKVSQNSPDLH